MSNAFIPQDPQNIALRPLNKGMDQENPPNMLKEGFFHEIKNYWVNERGLKRRSGWGLIQGGNQITDTNAAPLLDLSPLWKVDGNQQGVILSSSYLYTTTYYTAPVAQYWKYTTGYVSVSGSTMTGYGTQWNATASRLRPDDIVILDVNGTPEEAIIDSIDADNQITLKAAPTGTYTATELVENGNCEAATSPTLDGTSHHTFNGTFARSSAQVKYGTYSWLLTSGSGSTDLIEYGDGENASSITLDGGTQGLTNGTWASSTAQKHGGSKSWLLTNTSANALVYLDDVGQSATNDMHGLQRGRTYSLSAWGYTNNATATNAKIILYEYYSSAWNATITCSMSTLSAWENLTGSVTINEATTGVTLRVSNTENTKLFYVDDVTLKETGDTSAVLEDVWKSATNDLHGLTAGNTYQINLWMYSDVATATNAGITIHEYYSSAWHASYTRNPSATGSWVNSLGTLTLNAGTTGIAVEVWVDSTEAGKLLYIDDVSIQDTATSIDYEIRRVFHPLRDSRLDYTVANNELLIADYSRPLYSWDGTTFTEHSTSLEYISSCVTFFGDRLWIGNIIESGSYYRQRIRWSSTTNLEFFDPVDYYDLPYAAGPIRRLLPMGRMLVCYTSDAVYVGRPSNIPDLPYVFERVESGGVGLVGVRAVTSVPNGHYFLGQDDLYFLGYEGLQKLNITVKSRMFANKSNFLDVYLIQDPKNDQLILGFPTYSEMWFFNYKTQAWSLDDGVGFSFLANPILDLGLSWDDLTAYLAPTADWNTGMATFGLWDAIVGETRLREVYLGQSGYVNYLTETATVDTFTPSTTAAINPSIITAEYDLNAPDDDKTVLRLTLKLKDPTTVPLEFNVFGTVNGYDGVFGTTKNLGVLTIAANTREGRVNFKLTGSTFRFYLTGDLDAIYTITEIVVRVNGRDLESRFD